MKVVRSRVFGILLGSILLLLVFLFASCAGVPRGKAEPERQAPPEWVLTPPRETAQDFFFVGSASDPTGDAVRAEEVAVHNLIAEITRYIGVRVTAETTSEARATLNSFQAQVTQQIREVGTARVAGLRVVDKFIHREQERVSVYILAQYDRAELEKEKARIAAVFQEQVDAVAIPEAKGRRLEMLGDLFGAIRSYIEASVAATTSRIENAEIKFERNINHAKRVVARIGLVPLTRELSGRLGEPFPESFRVKIVDGQGETDPPVAGADVEVAYREARAGSRPTVRTVSLKSGETGVIEFTHPVPTFVGRESVVFMLNLSPYLRPLETVPRQYRALVASLEDLALSKRVDIPYSIVSRARDIPTGVVVIDLDAAGNPVGTNRTIGGILEALTEKGFRAISLNLDPSILRTQSDSEILRTVSTQFAGQVEHLVFGTAGIDEFIEHRGQIQVRVTGTIKAADLNTGQILYSKRLLKRSIGSQADAAIGAAFRNLGLDAGEDLARSLP